MPKIREIGYQTRPAGPVNQPRMTPQTGLGEGLIDVARGASIAQREQDARRAKLEEVEAKRQARFDGIQRVMAVNEYELEAQRHFDTLKAEKDIADPEVIEEYHTYLRDLAGSILSKHKGSEESRFQLTQDIEGKRGARTLSSYNESTSRQNELLSTHADSIVGTIVSQAVAAPQNLNQYLAQLGQEAKRLEFVNNPEIEQKFIMGRSQAIGAVISGYVESGQFDAADAVLSNPEYADSLSGQDRLKFTTQLAKGRYDETKIQREFNARKMIGESVFGKKWEAMTPDERASTQRMTIPDAKMTAADEIAERVAAYREATGQEPGDSALMGIVSKVTGAEGPGNPFGSGTEGAQLFALNSYKSKLNSGSMTRDDVFALNTLVREVYKPSTVTNPVTGETSLMYPEIDPDLVAGMRNAGLQVPLNGVMVAAPIGEAEFDRKYPPREARRGVAGAATQLAGPIASVSRILAATPVGGVFTDVDKKTAETGLFEVQANLVNFLQKSPKYAETERSQVKEVVKLEPGAWNNPENLQNTMLGWYDVVMDNLTEAEDILMASKGRGDTRPSPEMVSKAKDMMFMGPRILRNLGIRRTSDMPKDRNQFMNELRDDPPGTLYFDEERGAVFMRDETGPTVHKVRDF